MAKNDNLKDFLEDVADAIRAKKGVLTPINPQNFSNEILAIQTEGGVSLPSAGINDVTFYDYNGHILYSYSRTDFLALTKMPLLPLRDGLVCLGWTHQLEEAQEYVSLYRRLNIGAYYTTANGRTQIYFDVFSDNNLTRKISLTVDIANGIRVHYGDDRSGVNSGTGSRAWTITYKDKGSYVIELEILNEAIVGLGRNNSGAIYPFFGNEARTLYKAYPTGAGLRKIHCGDNVAYYYQHLCDSALDLQEISLSPSDTLGDYAFQYTPIAHCVIPKGMTALGNYVFRHCRNIKNVILPNTVTSLGGELFYDCCSLQTIDIPTGVTKISSNCFNAATSLEVVTIPKSVTSLGTGCFSGCSSLRLVNMSQHEEVPSLDKYSFDQSNIQYTIVVPDNLYDEWISSTNWSNIASRIVKASEYFTE